MQKYKLALRGCSHTSLQTMIIGYLASQVGVECVCVCVLAIVYDWPLTAKHVAYFAAFSCIWGRAVSVMEQLALLPHSKMIVGLIPDATRCFSVQIKHPDEWWSAVAGTAEERRRKGLSLFYFLPFLVHLYFSSKWLIHQATFKILAVREAGRQLLNISLRDVIVIFDARTLVPRILWQKWESHLINGFWEVSQLIPAFCINLSLAKLTIHGRPVWPSCQTEISQLAVCMCAGGTLVNNWYA